MASAFKALTADFGVARGSFEQVGASFLMTIVLTVLLVGVQSCPWERKAPKKELL